MKKYWIILLILSFWSCKPDTLDLCSPTLLSQLKYKGFTNICSGFPSQQKFFYSLASISAGDSLLTISISSLDSNVVYEQSVVVNYECVEGEPGIYAFELFQNDINVGLIGLEFVSLFIILVDSPCPSSSSFEGALVR